MLSLPPLTACWKHCRPSSFEFFRWTSCKLPLGYPRLVHCKASTTVFASSQGYRFCSSSSHYRSHEHASDAVWRAGKAVQNPPPALHHRPAAKYFASVRDCTELAEIAWMVVPLRGRIFDLTVNHKMLEVALQVIFIGGTHQTKLFVPGSVVNFLHKRSDIIVAWAALWNSAALQRNVLESKWRELVDWGGRVLHCRFIRQQYAKYCVNTTVVGSYSKQTSTSCWQCILFLWVKIRQPVDSHWQIISGDSLHFQKGLACAFHERAKLLDSDH